MIVTRLVGGLGNQMFQYAAGRSLALRHGVPLCIDRRSFEKNYKLRTYGLDCFELTGQETSTKMPPQYVKGGILDQILRCWLPNRRLATYREKSFNYDPGFDQLGPKVYLEGYWQSERYFAEFSDQIRRDFCFRTTPSALNQAWLTKTHQTLSVSLHVRRGDYASNPVINQVHGTCSLDYYANAIATLSERLDAAPEFFVFSDDPIWARTHLSFGEYTYHFIENNNEANAHEDLRLMASCSHHIIANSTFSWWGAWLNPRPDKIVVAPQRWFREESMDDSDLIPGEWLRA